MEIFLTPEQIAEQLQVAPETVRAWLLAGKNTRYQAKRVQTSTVARQQRELRSLHQAAHELTGCDLYNSIWETDSLVRRRAAERL
jgi:hypothetical protein